MRELFIYILRLSSLLGGLLFVYVALFLYETEQGKIQNVLEDLWIKINDRQHTVLYRHTLFMRSIAYLANVGLNKIFGERLFSLRAIGVSACLSLISIDLLLLIGALYNYYREGSTFLLSIALVLIIHTALAISPSLFSTHTGQRVWFTLVVMSCFLPIFFTDFVEGGMELTHLIDSYGLIRFGSFLIGIIIGIACDILFIAYTRWSLRWSQGLASSFKIAVVILLNCLLAFVLFLLPLLMSGLVLDGGIDYSLIFGAVSITTDSLVGSILSDAILTSAKTNLFCFLISLVFIVLAVVMLLHRILWPLIERPIYALQDLGIARRRKVLGGIGVLLIAYWSGYTPELLTMVEKIVP